MVGRWFGGSVGPCPAFLTHRSTDPLLDFPQIPKGDHRGLGAGQAKSERGRVLREARRRVDSRTPRHVGQAATGGGQFWLDAGELETVMLLKRGDQVRVVSGLAK